MAEYAVTCERCGFVELITPSMEVHRGKDADAFFASLGWRWQIGGFYLCADCVDDQEQDDG